MYPLSDEEWDEIFNTEPDPMIEMKCIRCGYEGHVPEFVYAEEADFLLEEGYSEPPCFACPHCGRDTFYKKGYKQIKRKQHYNKCNYYTFFCNAVFFSFLIELSQYIKKEL